MNKIKHLNSLNFFRAISGFGVCISHYLFYMNNIVIFEYLSLIFVEFFFILSGYVLTPQLLKINNFKNLKIFWCQEMDKNIATFYIMFNYIFYFTYEIRFRYS